MHSMSYGFSLIQESDNRKTGSMPVSYQHRGTCAPGCRFLGKECQSEYGYVRFHWDKLDQGLRGSDWYHFLWGVTELPRDIWRFGVAGDLPHSDGRISKQHLNELIEANAGREVIAFTHHDHTIGWNWYRIRDANRRGFTINRSFEQAKDAVAYVKAYDLPAVTTMPYGTPKVSYVDGVKIVMCPAKKDNKITCKTCRLCARSQREFIIGFRPIGKKADSVDIIARGA